MTPERWKQISEVAASAMELEGDEQVSFLEQACSGDEELRREVERLVRADIQSDSFLKSPFIAEAPRMRVVRDAGSGSGVLPRGLLEKAGPRLRLVAVAYALTYVGTDAMNQLNTHVLRGIPYVFSAHVIPHLVSALMVAICTAVYFLVGSGRLRSATVVLLGFSLEIVGSFGIGIGQIYGRTDFSEVWSFGSAIGLWIIAFSLLVPSPPRKATIAAFASAAVGPATLALWVAAAGIATPPAWSIIAMTAPNFMCAVLAAFAVRMIYGLGSELEKARQMGSYRLEKRLGRGGMGEVWLARHAMLARPAAIKLIRPEILGMSRDDTVGRRFEREAQATASLSSPHTIQLYDFGVDSDGSFYYVMELLKGLDLDSLVKRFGPIPAQRAAHFLRQVCLSLGEAHQIGLVHRDIKPANIYTCRVGLNSDFIKVLDFGLVKPSQMPGDVTRLTAEFLTPGTPGYMAPETATGGEVDARTDIYSLGCVGYWLVTGHSVFEGTTALQIVMHHVQTPVTPPSARCKLQIPREFEELLLWCLEKDPDRRPASVEKVIGRLDSLDLVQRWTEEQARLWWSEHRPGQPASDG